MYVHHAKPLSRRASLLLGIALVLVCPSVLGQDAALKQVAPGLVLVNITTSMPAPNGIFKDVTILGFFPSTGIVIDDKNHVLTFLGGWWMKIRSENPRIEVIESQGKRRKGRIVGIDQSTMVAVIECEGKALKRTPLCENCEDTDIATVVLPPQDLSIPQLESAPVVSIGTGRSSAVGGWTVQMSKPLTLIGGPLLNSKRQVVAIVADQEIQADPANMRVTITPLTTSQLLNSANKIIKKQGDIVTGWLGVYIDINYKKGVMITDIDPGSPAHKAGIRPGDVMMKWNGVAITDVRKYIEIVQNTPVGARAIIEVLRGGKAVQIQATIEARRRPLP